MTCLSFSPIKVLWLKILSIEGITKSILISGALRVSGAVDGAAQLGHFARRRVLHHLVAADHVGVAQAHLGAGGEAVPVPGRALLEVVVIESVPVLVAPTSRAL